MSYGICEICKKECSDEELTLPLWIKSEGRLINTAIITSKSNLCFRHREKLASYIKELQKENE